MPHDKAAFLSLILLVLVALLNLFPENKQVFVVAVLISCFCGLYGLMLLIIKSYFNKLFNIMAVSLLVGYLFGTSLNLFPISSDVNIFDYFGSVIDIYYAGRDISFALLIVLLVSSVLFGFSYYESPIGDKLKVICDKDREGAGKHIFICTMIVILGYLTGQFGFMGIHTDEFGNIGVLGAISSLIVPPFIPIIAIEILKNKSIKYNLFLVTCLFVFIVSSVIFGRRVFIYSLLCMLIGFSVSEIRLLNYFRERRVSFFLYIALFSFISLFGFVFFYAMRIASYTFFDKPSVLDIVFKSFFVISSDFEGFSAQLVANIIGRSFILSYLAGLVYAHTAYPFLWGEEIYNAFLTAIPSLFFPEKKILLPQMPEEIVHPALGISVFDGNNTIITAGYNDFGLIGTIVYPVLMIVAYIVFFDVIRRFVPSVICKFVIFRLIYQILFVEESLSGMVAACFRDITIIIILLTIISGILEYMCIYIKRMQRYVYALRL